MIDRKDHPFRIATERDMIQLFQRSLDGTNWFVVLERLNTRADRAELERLALDLLHTLWEMEP